MTIIAACRPVFAVTRPVPPLHDLLARSITHADLPELGRSLALLARAQAGDRGALEDLVSRYQDRLRRYDVESGVTDG